MDNKKIGEFISILRKSRNLTQKELADTLGITDKAVSKWERGAGYPDISMLHPLADALGTTVNELLEGESFEVISVTDSKNIDNALNYVDKIITTRENKLGKVISAILSISLIIAIFTSVIVNIAVNSCLSWSIFVIAGCIMAGGLFIPPLLWKKKGCFLSLFFLTVLIIPFLAIIESETSTMTGYGGWLWKLGAPISFIWLVFLWLMVFIRKAKLNIWFYICIGSILSIPCNLLTNVICDQYLSINPNDMSRQISNISSVICLLSISGICFVIGLLRKNK